MIPFDVAHSLVEMLIKEAAIINRLLELLAMHISGDELEELAREVNKTNTELTDMLGEEVEEYLYQE